ncbi:MAG: 16S rRNA (adenine(1518)-N(6)/adenine(1519)-N(6))-dimethyltransferase RsmA [Chloroflexi bacterium]|nr:16S rRNA (adenine(1518)-N(6)/adenine(1519)-N(6))-dimethyltransferase RsmA [Chloroflexota bacterium]
MPHKNREPNRAVQRRLRSHGFRVRKSLGQNFLVDDSIRDAIIEVACLTAEDTVLEVGPGLGALTEKLAAAAGKVIAVELDDILALKLAKKLGGYPNVKIVQADILKQDLNALVGWSSYKVVANIPYYITSPILRYFTRAANRPALMVMMMQEEVAREVTAPEGRMGFLAVSMRLFSNPEIIFTVPAASFYPVPRVDSAVVKFNMLPGPAPGIGDIDDFLEFLHCGFASPRKQLRNSLAIGLKSEAAEADNLLRLAGIDPGRRPGTLTLDEWAALYRVAGSERC